MNPSAKLNKIPDDFFLNLIAIFSFLNVVAWYWDGWWHVSLGRDYPFAPPHDLIYLHLVILILSAGTLFIRSREKVYLYLLLTQIATFFIGLLDILWHSIFGVEKIISPQIIWAPPHLLGFIAILTGLFLIFNNWSARYQIKDTLVFLRLVLVSGAIFGILRIVIFPLEPLGWHNVIGFSGVGLTAFVSILYLLYIVYKLPKTGIAIFTMLIFIGFIGFEATMVSPRQILLPHAKVPHWLHFMALLSGVLWLDFIDVKKYSPIIIGGLMGFLIYFVYFIFWDFIKSYNFDYSQMDALVLLLIATFGGIMAGFTYNLLLKISKELR